MSLSGGDRLSASCATARPTDRPTDKENLFFCNWPPLRCDETAPTTDIALATQHAAHPRSSLLTNVGRRSHRRGSKCEEKAEK
eukprot:CAMPEP_0118917918 /NCGR_PEP_ID=MMETSP1166-20130328/17603_1 /TAXON_ID=1104430 /ORGANISM="Chrysoreinhardia sp, Strain CCMP3193" /LENGTH=82 /DNA_ID=CAMNT_0006858143 /DNA_START=195 /DNA_END=440 /DNA_ORIENTATION=+